MLGLALIVGILCLAVAFLDLKRGLYLTVAMGFLQDPLRKIAPGQPVSFVLLGAIVFSVTFLGAILGGRRITGPGVNACRRALHPWLGIFLVVVAVGVAMTLVKTRNVAIAGIGLMAYVSPLPAFFAGAWIGRRQHEMEKLLRFYILASLVAAAGVYLAWRGVGWKVLEGLAGGLLTYTEHGTVQLHSGFMRAPEIAAWHAMAATCFVLLMTLAKKRSPGTYVVTVGVILVFMGAMMFTGRRKALAGVVVFIVLMAALLRAGGGRASKGANVLVAIMVGAGLASVFLISDAGEGIQPNEYLRRTQTIKGDTVDRIMLTVESLKWVIVDTGLFGAGAGMGSQGSQYYGTGQYVSLSAESGPGKVLAELGVQGLGVLVIIVIQFARHLWRMARSAVSADRGSQVVLYGFMAFLGANCAVFFTAHQIFGDPFVLLILGWSTGCAVAASESIWLRENAAKQALAAKPVDVKSWNLPALARQG